MIHTNLNTSLYTQSMYSPTKTIYMKYMAKYTPSHTMTVAEIGY